MHATAIAHLREADPVLRGVIEAVGTCEWTGRESGSHFSSLVRAIVFQQLSGKAAATILGRVHAIYGGRAPRPEELLRTSLPSLRSAGLSSQKCSYLRDLAEHSVAGRLPTRLGTMPDEAVVNALTAVKGIGPWTAQMFLMFRLARPDVLPIGDLGIQKAVQRAYGLRQLPKPARVDRIGRPWAPHRTIASWYLWRSLDNE